MRRKFSFSIDEYYHLYSRGTDKRTIFSDSHDYNRFVTLLNLCNSSIPIDIDKNLREGRSFPELVDLDVGTRIVDLGVYCLMPNHFHLLVREKQENGISIFMKKLLTGYSMYFNRRHKRTGRLFESSFQAQHVADDIYLKYLFSYIHLNPVKIIDKDWKENGIKDSEGAKKYLNDFKYSSYQDYVGFGRREGSLLNKNAFPEYFSEVKEFSDFISEWLNYKDYELQDSGKDRPPQVPQII